MLEQAASVGPRFARPLSRGVNCSETMTTFEGTDQFSLMSDTQQIRFLAHYAHELTVVSRGTYEVGTEDLADPRRLRHFNEVQHRVVGDIVKLLAKDTKG